MEERIILTMCVLAMVVMLESEKEKRLEEKKRREYFEDKARDYANENCQLKYELDEAHQAFVNVAYRRYWWQFWR